jgi:hypothetical protein
MATFTNKKVNKTEFIAEFLRLNPKANAKAVNEAWAEAGHPGSVSVTLVQKLRAELGLAGNLRGRSRRAKVSGRTGRAKAASRGKAGPGVRANGSSAGGESAAPAREKRVRGGDRERVLDEVEGELDRMIFRLIALGGLEPVEHALRSARRVIVRSQKA